MNAIGSRFGEELKRWRGQRGKTQLELSMVAGYSQRHVSFLESGRSKPSRATVLVLAEALNVPIKDRNQLLHAAGFAPMFSHEPLISQRLSGAVSVLETVLQNHRPFPALVVDRAWNVVASNINALALFGRFVEDTSKMGAAMNAMRLCIDPNAMRPFITNWHPFMSSVLTRLKHELAAEGEHPELRDLIDNIENDAEFQAKARDPSAALQGPIASLCLRRGEHRAELFTLMSVFGTPNDATLSELRIETFCPADDATRALLLAIDAEIHQQDPLSRNALPIAQWRSS